MPNQPRILILNERDPSHPRAGGAEIHIEEIFTRLASRGFGVTQYSVDFKGSGMPSVSASSQSAPPPTSERSIRIERHGRLLTYYASIPGRLARARRMNEFDIVVECLNKVPFFSPIFAGRPVLALCHHLFGEVAFTQTSLPIASMVWLAEKGIPIAYRSTPFVAISESTRDDLVARGIDPHRIRVSHPGIDPPTRTIDCSLPRPPRITYLGRLEAYKRVEILLEAAAKLATRYADLEIIVIGKGPERENLERRASQLGLASKTRFVGFVDAAERDRLLEESAACVFPSEKEGWGLTVIEANAFGTPVVASDVPGLRDSIQHDVTGILVEPGSADAFARGLARLLEDSPKASEMRAAAQAWSKRFRWETAADEMEAAIESSLDEAPHR